MRKRTESIASVRGLRIIAGASFVRTELGPMSEMFKLPFVPDVCMVPSLSSFLACGDMLALELETLLGDRALQLMGVDGGVLPYYPTGVRVAEWHRGGLSTERGYR
jgi:hypothetical protein